jgi:hypothetical protein
MSHIYQAITFPGNFDEVAGKAGQTACKAGHSEATTIFTKTISKTKIIYNQ